MYANGGTHRISNEGLGGPDLSAGPGGTQGGRSGGAAGPLEGATLGRARVPRVKVEISARVRAVPQQRRTRRCQKSSPSAVLSFLEHACSDDPVSFSGECRH